MGDDENEKFLRNSLVPIPIKGIEKILDQMKKCACKIHRKDGIKGTGFFCKILYQNELLPILATNWHILNLEEINYSKEIRLSLNNENEFKKITIDEKINENRVIFSHKDLDVTFVEIKKKDKINDFLEIDEDIINKNDEFLNERLSKQSIYLLNYQEENNMLVSFGLINSINNKEISHSCISRDGSSGSPIISLNTYKVIGIHTGKGLLEFNKGILIKYAIIEFNNIKNIKNNDFRKDNNKLKCLQKLNENCMIYQNLFKLELNNIS